MDGVGVLGALGQIIVVEAVAVEVVDVLRAVVPGEGLQLVLLDGKFSVDPAGMAVHVRGYQLRQSQPPESGRFNNPWGEWIGAQMRGTILGQLYPGDAAAAARAAWQDAEISHFHNGILGEVFNAILCAMAFCESDTRRLVQQAIDCIPADSQCGSVIRFALEQCRAHDDYLSAWRVCEKKLERYNWIHAYPNAAIEVIALWFGQGRFVDTLEICGICGKDSDCNSAQLMTILGSSTGMDGIPQDWAAPFQDRLDTYVRGMEHLSIRKLAARTAVVARRLAEVR